MAARGHNCTCMRPLPPHIAHVSSAVVSSAPPHVGQLSISQLTLQSG